MRYQEDVYKKTAEETGLSVEQIKLVAKCYWEGIGKVLPKPLSAGYKVVTAGGLKFTINYSKLGTFLGRLDYNSRYGRYKTDFVKAKQYYLNLFSNFLKLNKPREGQTSQRIDNARYSSYRLRERKYQYREKEGTLRPNYRTLRSGTE